MALRFRAVVALVALILIAVGCGRGSNGGDDSVPKSIVTGRVLDSAAQPVPVATVTIRSDPVVIQTDAEGRFSAEVERGDHQLTVTKGGMTLLESSFGTGAEPETKLGDLPSTIEYYASGATWYPDADGDGYSGGSGVTQETRPPEHRLATELMATHGDCNDAVSTIHPGAAEICGNGIDEDCDGVDVACPSVWYRDADGDGYSDGTTLTQVDRPLGYRLASELTATSGDCNDAVSTIHPGAAEICGNGIDEDCDGVDTACPVIWYRDADGDGYSDGTTLTQVDRPLGYRLASELTATSGDCDDSVSAIHPGALEICGNGVDEDCDGADSVCVSTWDVRQVGDILQVSYGSGVDYPQYAALHLSSSYFRLIYGPVSGWGPSLVLLPSFWETVFPEPAWEEVASPGSTEEIVALGDYLVARTSDSIYRSGDAGVSWQPLGTGLASGILYALCIDGQTLYVATANGLMVSTDYGAGFSWSFEWSWDRTRDVDIRGGTGWLVIDNWGGRSGPNRKTPTGSWELRRGDLPWASVAAFTIASDPVDPLNVAYRDGWRTLDGGEHWSYTGQNVLFTTVIQDRPVALSQNAFSDDHGETWHSLPFASLAFAKDEISGLLFAADGQIGAGHNAGVFAGRPTQWSSVGLAGRYVRSLAVLGSNLFAVDKDGRIFKTDLAPLRSAVANPVLRQGAPVTVTWGTDGADLLLSFQGPLSNLTTTGRVRLSPPAEDSVTAQVTVDSVAGDVHLAERPGEMFKPLFLSSMHISADSWDSQAAYVGAQPYAMPESGWIVDPPAEGDLFGLVGGTSSWKANSPSVDVWLDRPMQVTGWVTPSTDPNDDNVGFWAATNEILRAWEYTVTAQP